MYRVRRCFVLSLVLFLLTSNFAFAQKKLGLNPDKWATILSKGALNEVNSLASLTNQLIEADSLRAFRFLDSLEKSDNAKGYNFQLFFCMVKADFLYAKYASYDRFKDRQSKEIQPIKEEMMKLYIQAMDAAYHTQNDKTIGWVSFYSARRMRTFGEIGYAVMYSKNGVDLLEKVKYDIEPPVYTELAELLYQVREYDECIVYAKKGIAAWKNYENAYKDNYKYKTRDLNAIGLAFYQKNQQDSATAYYQQALQLAKENKDSLWIGTVLGNIGRIMYAQNKFDSAYLLFKIDYRNSKADSFYDNAAHASEWAARANLAKENKIAALAEAREAIHLLNLWPSEPYLRDTYYTLMQIFRSMGDYDSSYYYSGLYNKLNDSLEKVVYQSSINISKLRLDDEKNKYDILNLESEKQAQLQQRNLIIAAIVFLAAIGVLVINRERSKLKYRQKLLEHEKLRVDQEMQSAMAQLKMFTENIIEKTNLVEKLEQQLRANEYNTKEHQLIEELSNQTILTEDDWLKFKTLFEKTSPGFFTKLKQQVNDITLAEQRMAALTRLHLTTKQMAAILGISSNSVIKTKQRLRQRLNCQSDLQVDEFLNKL